MAMTPLVTNAQLARYFSQYGIDSYADHDGDGSADTSVVTDCIDYATGEIVGRLSARYVATQIVRAVVMVEYAAVVTLRELCLRRGNMPPASLELKYQEIMADKAILDKIADGKRPMVDADGVRIPQKGGYVPTHSNLTVDRGYSEAQIRVVTGTSNLAPTTRRRFLDRNREMDPQ